MHAAVLLGNLMGRDHLEDMGVDDRTILKDKQCVRM
jgi:hypothetical protein